MVTYFADRAKRGWSGAGLARAFAFAIWKFPDLASPLGATRARRISCCLFSAAALMVSSPSFAGQVNPNPGNNQTPQANQTPGGGGGSPSFNQGLAASQANASLQEGLAALNLMGESLRHQAELQRRGITEETYEYEQEYRNVLAEIEAARASELANEAKLNDPWQKAIFLIYPFVRDGYLAGALAARKEITRLQKLAREMERHIHDIDPHFDIAALRLEMTGYVKDPQTFDIPGVSSHTSTAGLTGRLDLGKLWGVDANQSLFLMYGVDEATTGFSVPASNLGSAVAGRANEATASLGLYYRRNDNYVWTSASYSSGRGSETNAFGNGKFDTQGYAVDGGVGHVFNLWNAPRDVNRPSNPTRPTRIDLDVGVHTGYFQQTAGTLADSSGFTVSDAFIHEASAGLSTTLFATYYWKDWGFLKPYVSLGYDYVFHYSATATIPAQAGINADQVVLLDNPRNMETVAAGLAFDSLSGVRLKASAYYSTFDFGSSTGGRLSASIPFAADIANPNDSFARWLPVKALKAPPVAPSTWAGFYIGGDVGADWASQSATSNPGPPGFGAPAVIGGNLAGGGFLPTTHGFARNAGSGGLHAGYNLQYGAWVTGLEGDVAFAHLGSSNTQTFQDTCCGSALAPPPAMTLATSQNWLASVRGRVGGAAGSWLFYGTAGPAWTGVSYAANLAPDGFAFPAGTTATANFSRVPIGLAAGAGVERMFSHWIARVEYLYYRFPGASGNAWVSGTANCPGCAFNLNFSDLQVQTLRAGMSYRF